MTAASAACPPPGCYRNRASEYYDWPAMSSSALKKLADSPAHYQEYLRNPDSDSPALRVGRMFHLGTLGTSEEFEAMRAGLKWDKKTQGEFTLADEMATSARQNPLIRRCLEQTKPEHRELAIVWEDDETGVLCKALLDAAFMMPIEGVTRGIILDLKSTSDASDSGCQRAFAEFRYFIQAAHYWAAAKAAGFDPAEFWFFFVEKKDPFAVNWMPVSHDALCDGQVARYKLLRRYQECVRSGNWPGYFRPERNKQLTLPAWAKKEINEL